MAIYYHGSSLYFEKFDLAFAGTGDGKYKFGYGVYVTEKYASAAKYAFNKKRLKGVKDLTGVHFYVYTVEIPDADRENVLPLYKRVPVSASLVARAEEKLGVTLPPEAKAEGIPFRKYLGNWMTGERKSIRQMTESKTAEGAMAASAFLRSIGVELIEWPQGSWERPVLKNMAVLDDAKVRILRIDEVDLDVDLVRWKAEFIPGSERVVKEF